MSSDILERNGTAREDVSDAEWQARVETAAACRIAISSA